MLTLGLKIGSNDSLVHSGVIWLPMPCNCDFWQFSSVCFFTFLLEKTLLPLKTHQGGPFPPEYRHSKENPQTEPAEEKNSILILIMPICIILGILAGYMVYPESWAFALNYSLTFSLVILYIGVGISFGMNRSVFSVFKVLSWKILLLPVAIVAGSLAGADTYLESF